jgi:hypothetical protein
MDGQMTQLESLYMAPLVPLRPDKGFGLFDRETGVCRFYSDGGNWLFEMGSAGARAQG